MGALCGCVCVYVCIVVCVYVCMCVCMYVSLLNYVRAHTRYIPPPACVRDDFCKIFDTAKVFGFELYIFAIVVTRADDRFVQ